MEAELVEATRTANLEAGAAKEILKKEEETRKRESEIRRQKIEEIKRKSEEDAAADELLLQRVENERSHLAEKKGRTIRSQTKKCRGSFDHGGKASTRGRTRESYHFRKDKERENGS